MKQYSASPFSYGRLTAHPHARKLQTVQATPQISTQSPRAEMHPPGAPRKSWGKLQKRGQWLQHHPEQCLGGKHGTCPCHPNQKGSSELWQPRRAALTSTRTRDWEQLHVGKGTETNTLHLHWSFCTMFSFTKTILLLFSASDVYSTACKKFMLPLYFQHMITRTKGPTLTSPANNRECFSTDKFFQQCPKQSNHCPEYLKKVFHICKPIFY